MGWETRRGKTYYYRKERVGKRVRSVYVGGGETAAVIAQFEAMQAEDAALKRELARREREELQAQDALEDAIVNDVCSIIDTLTSGALLAAGYHTHKGQWRRKRHA